jgi:hypothetical protein
MLTDREIQLMVRDCSPMAGKLGTACLPIIKDSEGDSEHGPRCAIALILLGIAFCKTSKITRSALVQIVGEVYDHTMVVEHEPGAADEQS